jgi:DNA-binding NtrC family response regulator
MSCATSALMPASAGSHVRSILVVDDEEPIRMVLTGFFEDNGYHVVEACDVAEAKGILADRPVDLVFSDINMPGRETGFVLEKWVRQHYPRTKVLLTSGGPQVSADIRDLLEPLVPKPYSYRDVLQRVERILSDANHQV